MKERGVRLKGLFTLFDTHNVYLPTLPICPRDSRIPTDTPDRMEKATNLPKKLPQSRHKKKLKKKK